MESFTFKDISSDSLGLIIKDMPLVPRAEKNIEIVEVSGRNGNLHIDNENYLSKSYSVICIATKKDKIDSINSSLSGTGKLTLSKYSDRYFNATIKNQIDYTLYLNTFHEFPIQFDLDPIAYSNQLTEHSLTESGNINVGGNVEVFPTLIITGVGNVTINGYSLSVEETGITVDCELMNCTKNGLSANDKVILDEFPKLKVGNNDIVIGEGITQLVIKYRKGRL